MSDSLDRARVQRLAAEIMRPIAEHYRDGPAARDKVFEVLNALGFATAVVISGTGDRSARRQTREFFDQALEQGMREALAKKRMPLQ